MKIYRAVFNYNNADYCEWERWYAKRSKWYSRKELAESHLDELHQFKDWLKDYFKELNEIFKYEEPFIEEVEISEELVPFKIEHNEDYVYNNSVNFV